MQSLNYSGGPKENDGRIYSGTSGEDAQEVAVFHRGRGSIRPPVAEVTDALSIEWVTKSLVIVPGIGLIYEPKRQVD